ncbi:MAG TPA: phosphoenolpyruvate synthase regulatory protein, partial [Kiloniellaceae bacterium]|nr:phosphoenolpyruvate synthase regulatory protein [Kiloniellaceae bacterium]
MATHHLHLVSDSTGETINSVARACLVQFSGVEPVEHVWSLVRTRGMMNKVVSQIEAHPGPVL